VTKNCPLTRKDVVKRGDQKIEIVWNVSANTKYGYPGPFDKEVHKAVDEQISLAKQQINPGNHELQNTGFISKFD